jgi:probable rRNA maturation factor
LHRVLQLIFDVNLPEHGLARWYVCSNAKEEATEKGLVILQKKVDGLSEGTLARFVMRARREAGLRGTVDVLVTGSAAVRSLNHQFRGKNKATDVLSFPALASSVADSRRRSKVAGEIAISADIAAQNAIRLGHSPAQEIKVLALHGILHLAGFDHERDNGEMGRKEAKLRRALGLPAALIERAQGDGQRLPKRDGKATRRRV